MRVKPDYRLRLLKDGVAPGTDLFFYDFHLFSISVLGGGNYSTTVNTRYDGQMHALSLDFNQRQLEEILARADLSLAASIRAELSQDAVSIRSIDLNACVTFAVRARSGRLQTAEKEQFIPLITQEIL
jgi:hypothetical protein